MEENKFVLVRIAGGAVVKIPRNYKYATCECGAKDIVWVLTSKGRDMPIRWSHKDKNWASHFFDCPLAEKFRRKK